MSTSTQNYGLIKPQSNEYYDIGIPNGNMDKIDAALAALEAGKASLGEDGKVEAEQLPQMDYDPSGSAAAVQANLDSHIGNSANPHGVTAQQVGADPAGTASSAISAHNQDGAAHPEILAKLDGFIAAKPTTFQRLITGRFI